MKIFTLLSIITLLGCMAYSSLNVPETKAWHKTESLSNEPVSLPVCKLERVLKLKVGDKIGDIERIVGFPAVQYYYGADFLTLHTSDPEVEGFYWEVAIRKNGSFISDISFKKIPIKPMEW